MSVGCASFPAPCAFATRPARPGKVLHALGESLDCRAECRRHNHRSCRRVQSSRCRPDACPPERVRRSSGSDIRPPLMRDRCWRDCSRSTSIPTRCRQSLPGPFRSARNVLKLWVRDRMIAWRQPLHDTAATISPQDCRDLRRRQSKGRRHIVHPPPRQPRCRWEVARCRRLPASTTAHMRRHRST